MDHVLPAYKYASLAELNAVLRQYNILADRGSKASRIYRNNGLVYRMLDAEGRKIGVPVKASLIYSKPTLKNIEARFEGNDRERQRHKLRVMNAIDFAFFKRPKQTLDELIRAIQKENIQVVLRQNDKGIVYGITYVDYHTKCVFNGSHLGKQYSANAIQQRCGLSQVTMQQSEEAKQSIKTEKVQKGSSGNKLIPLHKFFDSNSIPSTQAASASSLLNDLLQPEENRNAGEPFEQKNFKRKRKRKQQHSHN